MSISPYKLDSGTLTELVHTVSSQITLSENSLEVEEKQFELAIPVQIL